MVVFDVERLAKVLTSSFKCENGAKPMHVKAEPMLEYSTFAEQQIH